MLHLLSTPHHHTTLQPVVQPDPSVTAANDRGAAAHMSRQLNVLVASVVGNVAARVQARNVNVALRLAPSDPRVQTDPAELSFIVGAVLGAALRVVDEEHGNDVGVHVCDAHGKVRILFTTDGVPPIRFVRALSGTTSGEEIDPTLAHCRRLIERRGGSLVLTQEDGRLGFAVELPRASQSPHARLQHARLAA